MVEMKVNWLKLPAMGNHIKSQIHTPREGSLMFIQGQNRPYQSREHFGKNGEGAPSVISNFRPRGLEGGAFGCP